MQLMQKSSSQEVSSCSSCRRAQHKRLTHAAPAEELNTRGQLMQLMQKSSSQRSAHAAQAEELSTRGQLMQLMKKSSTQEVSSCSSCRRAQNKRSAHAAHAKELSSDQGGQVG